MRRPTKRMLREAARLRHESIEMEAALSDRAWPEERKRWLARHPDTAERLPEPEDEP